MECTNLAWKWWGVSLLLGVYGHRPEGNDPGTLQLSGLDCRKPQGMRYSRLDKLCDIGKPLPEPRVEGILILQEVSNRVTKGYRCERRVTRLTAYCGAYSHLKLFQPPTIERLETIAPATCKEAASTGRYVNEDGRSIPVIMNGESHYKRLAHGTITSNEENVYCNGAKVTLNGELHGSVIEFMTVRISISHIEVEVSNTGIVDLDNHQEIPDACTTKNICGSETASYYLPESTNRCRLAQLRHTMAHSVQLKTAKGMRTALVDHQHKILLELGEKKSTGPNCSPYLKEVWTTNFPELKVVLNPGATVPESLYLDNIEELGAPSVNLNLELQVSLRYLEHHVKEELTARLGTLGRGLCSLDQNRMTSTELSPFRANSLMRTRGDLIQEIFCKPVELTARLGETRNPACIQGALPVYLHGEPVYISTPHHLVLEEREVMLVNCNMTYPPVFVCKDGMTLVQADPEVRQIKLQVEQLRALQLEETTEIEEEEYSESLLYTHEEVLKLENLINFGRVREKAVHRLVNQYCSRGNDCGNYQPSEQMSQGFDLNNLEEIVNSPLDWLTQAWQEKLEKIGAYSGLVVMLSMVVFLSWKLARKICSNLSPKSNAFMNIGVLFKTYPPRGVESPSLEYDETDQHEGDGREHPDGRLRQYHPDELPGGL